MAYTADPTEAFHAALRKTLGPDVPDTQIRKVAHGIVSALAVTLSHELTTKAATVNAQIANLNKRLDAVMEQVGPVPPTRHQVTRQRRHTDYRALAQHTTDPGLIAAYTLLAERAVQ